MRPLEADAVLITHGHHDHCCHDMLRGNPIMVEDVGEHIICGVRITGFSTWHDSAQGTLRGPNTMYLIEMDGLRIVHAGDLGEMPGTSLTKRLGRVDVLMIPVGGTYTLTGEEAAKAARAMGASVVIPMHYKVPGVTYPITDEKPFLEAMDAQETPRERRLVVTPLSIQSMPRVIVMLPEA